ncbi:hypothetical protein [Brotaphodocola sp.]|uniref:hypothetical protein n=1 Tax=Brotaphodocola sp. TaxID=3073577 RepID=UPI003D7EDBCB
MNRKRKFVSVGQQIHRETIWGIVCLIAGFFFSYKGIYKHSMLIVYFGMVFLAYDVFSIMQGRNCEEERFDEMAMENLNKASHLVLIDFNIAGAVILTAGFLQEVLKNFFSIEIQWGEYFAMSPVAFVLLILGFKYLMTGFHFKRLERE